MITLQRLRSWLPGLVFVAGLAMFVHAHLLKQTYQLTPLRIDVPRLLRQPMDTNVVLPRSKRYQLVLHISLPSGDLRNRLRAAESLIEFEGDIAGRPWSTRESGSTGTSSSGDFYLGSAAGTRGDTLRLNVRAAPELAEWMPYSPTLALQLDYMHTSTMPMKRIVTLLIGWIFIAVSVFEYWQSRRRRRAAAS